MTEGGKWDRAMFKLKPHGVIPETDKPVLVIVLDGFGEDREDEFNAAFKAHMPCLNGLKQNKPNTYTLVKAHGTAVGLPSDADMGNSEVGHNALGSGQVVEQGAKLVDESLASGAMFEYEGWQQIEAAAKSGTLHLIGLLSDGGVHSRYDQLHHILTGAVKAGVKRIRVHTMTDGRDVDDGSSVRYMKRLTTDLQKLGEQGVDAKVASGGGRMRVTMDRYESDWNIVKRGWEAHVLGEAPTKFTEANEAIAALRKPKEEGGKPISDQWLEAFVITDESGKPVGTIEDGDAVVIFNFRADRVVEISKALEMEKFDAFDRKRFPKTKFAGVMQYDGELKLPKIYLVPPPHIEKPTGQYVVANDISTYAVSESQKIGHVTFFWNGNRSGYFDENLENYDEIKSDQNIAFNEKPRMKCREITAAAVEALRSGKYRHVRLNFPNPDMVGHTGDFEATVEGCTAVDECVKELIDTVDELGGRWLVTADHGNAECMVQRDKKGNYMYEDGKPLPLTSHTLAPVPVAIGGPGLPKEVKFRQDIDTPGLANVGGTILNLLGLQTPKHMEPSLIAG